jgi:ABC-type glycerol-3-phosphate transport system substrate-binding protein
MKCSIQSASAWILVMGLIAGCGVAASRPTSTASPTEALPSTPILTSAPGPTSTSSVPPLRGRVSLWLDWDPARMQALIEAIRGFKARHPQVEFDLSYYPTDQLLPAFEEAAAGHLGPSVVIGSSIWGRAFADQGWIRDISPYLLPSQQNSIQPVVWSQVSVGSQVLGLPLTLEGNVLYRNTTLAPEPALTVGDLVQAAQDLKATKGFGASLDFGLMVSAPQIAACGIKLDTQAVLPFDEAGGECWLGLMQRLGRAGKPVFNSDDDRSQFASGKSAWLIDSNLQLDSLVAALGRDSLAVDPWPADDITGGHLNGYVWSENAYLTSSSSNVDVEASWAFLAYLLAPETQAAMDDVEGALRVPSVVGVAVADPLLDRARTVLQAGQPRPFSGDLNRLSGLLDTALRLVVGQAGDVRLATMLTLQEIQKANLATATPTATPAQTSTATPSSVPSATPPGVPATASPSPQATPTPSGP